MSAGSATEWYYFDHQQRQCGPVTALAIVRGFHARTLSLDTPVWRDGMPHWQPIRQRLADLGLPDAVANVPPPLPGSPPPLPPGLATSATPAPGTPPITSHASVHRHAATTSGNRTLVWVTVGVACALGLVFVLAILAAIALPAYQDYTLRAKTSAAIAMAPALQTRIESYYQKHQRCPGNQSPGFPPRDVTVGPAANISVGRFDNGHCGFELTLGGQGSEQLDGKALWFDYDDASGRWTCSSEIDNRFLPAQCRTP